MDEIRFECSLWTIRRMDGVEICVTDHDCDIEFDEKIYRSSAALDPSEVTTHSGLSLLNMDVLGAIDNEIFVESEILAGLFENAQIEQIRYDWKRQSKVMTVFIGRVGSIKHSNSRFQFDLCSSLDQLNGVFGRSYQKTCNARFCDENCTLKKDNFSETTTFIRAEGRNVFVENCAQNMSFQHGVITFLDRTEPVASYGIEGTKKCGDALKIEMRNPLKFLPQKGEAISLTYGCDKSFESCIAFENAVNFQGFPHMPGEVILNASTDQSTMKN